MKATATMVDDALRFMGVPREARSGELAEKVRRTFELLEGFARPRRVWGRFPVSVEGQGICLGGAVRIESGDLARLMARSRECWILAVTLGPEVKHPKCNSSHRIDVDDVMENLTEVLRKIAKFCYKYRCF